MAAMAVVETAAVVDGVVMNLRSLLIENSTFSDHTRPQPSKSDRFSRLILYGDGPTGNKNNLYIVIKCIIRF